MIEVTQHDENSSTFLTESVSNRYPDFVKGDVGGSGGGRVRCLDLLGFDAWTAFDEHNGETILRLAPYCKAAMLVSGDIDVVILVATY